MEKPINLFMQWEQMTPEERTYFAGLVEGYGRAPREAAAPAAAPKQRKTRKPRAAAPMAQAAAAGAQ